jgi:DNA-directed RNA polymerase subunit M/transcription elongation factor TFIIS
MGNDPSASSLTGELAIEVFGADLKGRQFVEQTRTLTITRDGATIPLANKLAPESELIIRNPMTNEEADACVLDLIQDADSLYVYGIAFTNPSVNLWQVESPEVQSQETTTLKCSRCHAVEAVLLGEIQREIVESKQELRRHCECSHSWTIWKRTDEAVTERRATERGMRDRRQQISPIEEPTARAPQERRRERRTSMKAAACIQCYDGDVVVECEDVSRGGFRFQSGKAYEVGMRIKAAIPYAKSSVNIFVTAQIVYQQELSGGFYRHGVAYVKSVKKPDSKS